MRSGTRALVSRDLRSAPWKVTIVEGGWEPNGSKIIPIVIITEGSSFEFKSAFIVIYNQGLRG